MRHGAHHKILLQVDDDDDDDDEIAYFTVRWKRYFMGCKMINLVTWVPERGVARLTWPSLSFYTSWNIFGTAKATDFKFCARFGREK